MDPDTLDNLLKHADAAAGPARVDDALAARVPRLAARRRARRLALSATAAALVLAAGVSVAVLSSERRAARPGPIQAVANRPTTQSDPQRSTPVASVVKAPALPPGPSVAELKERVAQLEAEARVREAVIRRLLAREQRDRAYTTLARLELAAEDSPVDEQVERAAMITLAQGDRQRATDADAAANSYRRVLELFPQTETAALARERLSQLNTAPTSPRDHDTAPGSRPAPVSSTPSVKGSVS